MPMYEYQCGSCGRRFDQLQRIVDDPLTADPECGGPVRRVIQPVGIIFKGSGFYATDSRKSGSASTSADSNKADTKSEGKNGSSGSDSSKSEGDSKGSSDSKSASESKSSGESKPAAAAAS